jgi:hypothetical protein
MFQVDTHTRPARELPKIDVRGLGQWGTDVPSRTFTADLVFPSDPEPVERQSNVCLPLTPA